MSRIVPKASAPKVRHALVSHLSDKLGYSFEAFARLSAPLSNDDLARCLRSEAETSRQAVFSALSVKAQALKGRVA